MDVRNLISFDDVDIEWWDSLYALCRDIMSRPDDYRDACRGKLLASLFFEPSTRTRFSFQAAMLRLGGSLFGFSNPNETSMSKGESLADTIRMTSCYADTIVMRTKQEGAAKAASLYSEVPIINAGDGGHLHPTQTLTDLTTIARVRGGVGDITVGLCGDLKYGRTVHSLVTALAKFPNIRFVLIAPEVLKMPDYMLTFMRSRGMAYSVCDSLEEAIDSLDVLYMTRIQRERFGEETAASSIDDIMSRFTLTVDKLRRAKADLTVLHPLPRVTEIERAVDNDPRAKYFEQARYGMYIRMALLLKLTSLPRGASYPQNEGGHACDNPECVTRTELYLPRLVTPDGACGYCDKQKRAAV
ncbi:MAG: aspartate carbamoyltransferase [Oscillospiraceae bacterium]|jgi:aspartate carbamoyltransferase catalytic subunit|nr:aspartate carbamoyltransferase [Oscillospiraceae bacterium]